MDDMKHQIVSFLEQICNDFRLSPMSDKELAERFNFINNTRYDVDLLAAQFQNTRKLILKNESTSIFFKIGLLFVSQEVVSTVFEQGLGLQNICIYKLDMERKLISFYPKKSTSGRGFEREGNGYPNRNFTCPINRLPWNIYETTKLFNFIQSRTRGTPFHVNLEELMVTYKEKEASRRTVEQLVAKATQYLTRDVDTVKWMTLGVKAQIIYTLQIPLSPVFLNELYQHARFQVKDGKLSYFRSGNLTVGREDDELITRVPKKLYFVFLEHMAKKPGLMSLQDLAEEFVREFEHFATKDEVVARILKMLDTRFYKFTLDPITRICILFKTQITIPQNFEIAYLKKLELGELDIDEENRIKSFVSNDGTINLNIKNEVPLENNQGRKRTLAAELGEENADTPASKKPATHSPMSSGSPDDQFEDDCDDEVDPCAADLPGTSFEVSSQCQNLLQQCETAIQSNQNDFCFVEPKEEKGVEAYQDDPVTSASLSSTCQNLLEQINASIEDPVQVTVPDYTFIMPKQESAGLSYDRNLSNINRNASNPARTAPSAPNAPTTSNFVSNEPEYDEADLVPLVEVKQEEEDESDDEIPTDDLNPDAVPTGNLPPPPQKARPMIAQTRVSQVLPSSRPLIPASNRRPMYHPSQSQASSYKEIIKWLQTALKTLSPGDFNDLIWNIEVEINNKKKSYKTVPHKYLAHQFTEAYRYITVCLNTDPKADNMIPVSEVFLLFRYEFNVLAIEELNDLTNDIMSFMRTPSRYNSMISVNELRSIMGGLFNKLECTTN